MQFFAQLRQTKLHEFDVKMSEVYPVTVFVTKGEITDEQSKVLNKSDFNQYSNLI